MAESRPDVSVVMPTYNSAPFLKGSVDTVLGQRDVSAELIVVDDKGTDGTRAVLENIRDSDPDRVTLIYRESGLGQATARNVGMSAARGRYIALLDSDDHFDNPSVLANWVSYADRLKLDMAGGQFRAQAEDLSPRYARYLEPTGDRVVSVHTEATLANATSCWQFLYRRRFLEETGTIFSPRLRQREDRLFLLEAMLKAERIGVMPDLILCKNHRDDSSFRQIDRDQVDQYVQHLRELNQAFAQANGSGRDSLEFETANCAISLASLTTYWRKIYLELSSQEDCRELLREWRAQYQELCRGKLPFFRSKVLGPSMYAYAEITEGALDVLRLAFVKGDESLVYRLMARDRLTMSELEPLRSLTPDAEACICRYLSFHRDQFEKTTLRRSSRPLAQLVDRIIFHVGAPKTGTSMLQHTLERNRFQLLEHGFHYPVAGTYREKSIRRERTPGHARLLNRLFEGDRKAISELAGEIEALGRKVHTLILSSENVVSTRFWRSGTGFQTILNHLDVGNVEVACLLRRPDEWIRSYYKELCANPWNSFTASPKEFFEMVEAEGLLNAKSVLTTLQAPRQVSRLHVDALENVRGSGGTVKWFIDTFGLTAIDWQPVEPSFANESLSEAQAALILLSKFNPGLSRAKLADTFTKVLESRDARDVSSYLIPAETMEAFRERHESGIASYCDRFGLPHDIKERPEAVPSDLIVPADLFRLLTSSSPAKSTKTPRPPSDQLQGYPRWRRALVPMLKPLIQRVSTERAVQKFERDPQSYFRDIKNPVPRQLGRLLFP